MDGEHEGPGPAPSQDATWTESRAIGMWLRTRPTAVVGALGGDGLPVPMPATMPLAAGQRVDDRSLLTIVAPGEATKIVGAFQAVLDRGLSAVDVRLADAQAAHATVHYFDLRPSHGVILRALVPGEGASTFVPGAEAEPARPRLVVWQKDERSRIRGVDDATEALLGWTREEMVGRLTLDFIHPDDHSRAIDNWMAFIAGGLRHTVRLRYRTRSGGWLWMETSNELTTSADGQSREVVCQIIDISEEMAATEALRYREQLLRRLTETVPVGLAELASDRSVRFVNPTLSRLLSDHGLRSPEGLVADLPPADAVCLGSAIDDCVDSGIDSEVDIHLPSTPSAPTRICRVALRSLVEGDRIRGALLCVVDVTELTIKAATDPLTGLHNRASIFEVAERALRSGRTGLLFIDLDRFKPVNDRFGHELGDHLLVVVSDAMREVVRETDTIGRIGGDEFLVVCPQVGGPDALLEIGQRVIDAVAACRVPGHPDPSVTASIGALWTEAAEVSVDAAVARADAAMYAAKNERSRTPLLWTPAASTAPAQG